LVDVNDPEDLAWLKEMIGSLLDNMPLRIQTLAEKIESGDRPAIQSELHQIKGVAANFGLSLLSEIVVKAESEAKSGNLEIAIQTSQNIPDAWEKTKQELIERFGS
jgi:HPt (histidine-containing phosphotransfer) domain-containing protein